MPLDTTLPTLFPELLSAADAAVLHQHAEAADAAGALHPEQQALIHARGWLRALAPREVGGEEWPLPRMVRLEEAIAAADGSCGWVVTLCAGAGWFAGFLPLALARSLMATPQLCLAGSGAVGGVAEREGAGWRLRGEWGFATGAPMATHFTLNARLQRDGLALSDASGQPRVQAFVLDAAQVRAGTGWRSLGMRSTGTHGFAVDGVWVPETQAFDIRPEAATAAGALYQFPFVELAWVTLAANLSGMAQAFLALAGERVGTPRREGLVGLLRGARAALAPVRQAFHAELDAAWAEVQQERRLSPTRAEALRSRSAELVHTARRAVDEVYPGCGLAATHEDSALNRVWRDLHTATQHAMLMP